METHQSVPIFELGQRPKKKINILNFNILCFRIGEYGGKTLDSYSEVSGLNLDGLTSCHSLTKSL
jgi:hypothetical protein